VVNAAPAAPRTLAAYLDEAPPEVRAVLNQGLKMVNERKEAIIKGLKSTNRLKIEDARLQSMSIEDLEALAELANIPVFNGRNPPDLQIVDNASEGFAPSMPPLIPAKTA
jgi:hypothetical protein